MAFTYTLEISEATLQKKISAMMPMEKKKYIFTVTLSEPEVELIDGNNEMSVFSHIEIMAPKGIRGSGRAKITGSLSYKAETCEFFIENLKIEKFEIDKVSEKYNSQIKAIVQLVGSKMLEKWPVYRLKDDKLHHKLVKAMLQSVSVKDKKLRLKLKVL